MKKSLPNDLLIPEVAELIRQGHTVTLTARGNSMNPFIVDRRDRVVLSPCTDAQLQPGAVVLALTDDHRYVLHRIVCRRGDELTLLGDGNLHQTERTDTGRVVGLLTAGRCRLAPLLPLVAAAHARQTVVTGDIQENIRMDN